MLDKLKKFFNHERYQLIAGLVICVCLFWLFSCESQVQSLTDPYEKVTRSELEAEVDWILAQARIRMEQLDQQDSIKSMLAQQAMLFATTGTVNPMGVMAALFAVFGIGASIDNVRKRIDIKKFEKDAG